LAALEITSKKNILQVSTESRQCRLTTSGYKNILRFVELNEIKYNALLQYYKGIKRPSKIALLSWDRKPEQILAKSIEGDLKAMGIAVVPLPTTPIGGWNASEIMQELDLGKADATVLLSPYLPGSDRLFQEFVKYNIKAPILTVGFVGGYPGQEETIVSRALMQFGAKLPELYVLTDFDAHASETSQEFHNAYESRFNKPPDEVSAKAYDSILFIAGVIRDVDNGPEKVVSSFKSAKPFEGVTGTTSILESGDIIKQESLIQIWHGPKSELRVRRGPKPKPHTIK